MKLKIKDLNKEQENDFKTGLGFIIDDKNPIIKKIKNPKGIYSPYYGIDENNYFERYTCKCKEIQGKFFEGEVCSKCGTKVENVPLNLKKTGWMFLEKYYLIHPIMYMHLCKLISSKKLELILKGYRESDLNGNIINPEGFDKSNPYNNIGMLAFQEKFDEIIEYYKTSKNIEVYNFIVRNKEKIFINRIPVFSLALRDLTIIKNNVIQEPINKKFNYLLGSIKMLNRNRRSTSTMLKLLPDLWEAQKKLNELIIEVINLIGGKYGHIRSSLLGTRINYSARCVITPLTEEHEINEVVLPYLTFMEVFKNEIIYMIKQTGYTYLKAYECWENACQKFDKRVYMLMKRLIKYKKGGLSVLINRNPTINYGSMLLMTVKDVKQDIEDYTLSIPLQILALLGADFDGDVLNIISIKFTELVEIFKVFDPRYMIISKNDGKFNRSMGLIKDQIIGLYAFNK